MLVLCGGIGHSSDYIYEAVAKHPRYNVLAKEAFGRPEAQVLRLIAERFFDIQESTGAEDVRNRLPSQTRPSVSVYVEDKSTNCGQNASFTVDLLRKNGITRPRSIVVVQDPTMCLRTTSCFIKVFEDDPKGTPSIVCWPTFIPSVVHVGDESPDISSEDPLKRLALHSSSAIGLSSDLLWPVERFVDLIMGEIPRLRDDSSGYGPRGRGFITHVDIPQAVECAWHNVRTYLGDAVRLGSRSQ